jgi:hypothetical protein
LASSSSSVLAAALTTGAISGAATTRSFTVGQVEAEGAPDGAALEVGAGSRVYIHHVVPPATATSSSTIAAASSTRPAPPPGGPWWVTGSSAGGWLPLAISDIAPTSPSVLTRRPIRP